MKLTKNKAFTLVELLVVITILSIISVVAYQNFGGAVDKAVSSRKITDVSTIETSLQQYKVDKNYYPKVGTENSNNLWGYNSSKVAYQSNTIQIVPDGEAIKSLTGTVAGGGKVYGSGNIGQIGAKGTISINELGKRYLSKDLYDPEVGDVKLEDIGGGKPGKMIDLGIGRYVYATFKKTPNWPANQSGVAYNIAYTIKKKGSDKYITKIVGDYDENSCYEDKNKCPKTLIGTLSGSTDKSVLLDGSEISMHNNSSTPDYGIPYAVTDFAQ